MSIMTVITTQGEHGFHKQCCVIVSDDTVSPHQRARARGGKNHSFEKIAQVATEGYEKTYLKPGQHMSPCTKIIRYFISLNGKLYIEQIQANKPFLYR